MFIFSTRLQTPRSPVLSLQQLVKWVINKYSLKNFFKKIFVTCSNDILRVKSKSRMDHILTAKTFHIAQWLEVRAWNQMAWVSIMPLHPLTVWLWARQAIFVTSFIVSLDRRNKIIACIKLLWESALLPEHWQWWEEIGMFYYSLEQTMFCFRRAWTRNSLQDWLNQFCY